MPVPNVVNSPVQPDLSIPLLDALLANYSLVEMLPSYNNSFTIFTRRPVPTDAPYPMIVISPDIAKVSFDGFADQRPKITRDIAVYGLNHTSRDYRNVELIANMIFTQFHSIRDSLVAPEGWMIADVDSRGPLPAPTDDDMFVGRVVSVDVLLARLDDA